MERKRLSKQTKTTGKNKKLSTKSKDQGKGSTRSGSKKSIERKDKTPAKVKDFPIVLSGLLPEASRPFPNYWRIYHRSWEWPMS
ncbi:MAG TPA: hypothetical protein VFT15_17215 [Chitinophagaceae bacterium]|nr:hypothetical protein [Chitinophagaceae bacterium]